MYISLAVTVIMRDKEPDRIMCNQWDIYLMDIHVAGESCPLSDLCVCESITPYYNDKCANELNR